LQPLAKIQEPGRRQWCARSPPLAVQRKTIRSASRYGSGRRRTLLTTLKMAMFAPMPSASVRIATVEKPGDFVSDRAAYRAS